MTYFGRLVASAVVATTLVGGANLAGAMADSPSPARHSVTRLTFVAHDEHGNLAFDDLGQPSRRGPDIGDVLAFTQRLTRGGRTVGRVSNAAVGVDHKRHLFQSNGSVVLRHGTIEYAGLVSQTSHFVLAVTGGTGIYRGVSGKLAFDSVGHRQLITVSFTR